MYLARFSYDVLPVNRRRAIDFIRHEVEAARAQGLKARLLVPLTRGQGGAALQFEVELTGLDQLDRFRHGGGGSGSGSGSGSGDGGSGETGEWMHAFSEILLAPPGVELLRLDEAGP